MTFTSYDMVNGFIYGEGFLVYNILYYFVH
jgi:hypothetical protein